MYLAMFNAILVSSSYSYIPPFPWCLLITQGFRPQELSIQYSTENISIVVANCFFSFANYSSKWFLDIKLTEENLALDSFCFSSFPYIMLWLWCHKGWRHVFISWFGAYRVFLSTILPWHLIIEMCKWCYFWCLNAICH